ncbi:MAG: Z1 domain-containing protein [Bacteroidota bacterium]|nr:Z1 domain-containing protein [Bacteroidota bacterium]
MLQNAIRTIRTLLPSSGFVTPEQIEEAVNTILVIPQYSNIDRQLLIREVQALYNIRIEDFRIIEVHERRRPWLSERKSSVTWSFWNRYRDYLEIEKNFSPEVLNKADRLTDQILDALFDPSMNGRIDKRGLVVGQVQSGKTSNYTGLICKAADAGYKLIIVLAGIHNNLRSQTQLRLDEGFLGFDTQHQRAFNQNNLWIGVGNINRGIIAHSLTSSMERGDFTAGAANALGLNFNTNEPIIAVVKKNASVLNRLLQWLLAQSHEAADGSRVIGNKSLLMIDDEADNASINTRPVDDGATRINELIRNILRLFDKSGYVGYTATPFANIFIPLTDDDLFPRDFIINLPAPSNYIGPEKVFGFDLIEDDDDSDSVLPIVSRIDDFQTLIPNGHQRNDTPPASVPDSLRLAVKCFILTCAVRRLRGQVNVHNSMLVHVSRFINWQRDIKNLVESVFDFYKRGIEFNIPAILEELRIAFEEDTDNYKSYRTTSQQIINSSLSDIDTGIQIHTWSEVLPLLNDAASRIIVREINGGSGDVLNYYDHTNGLSVIAIGGDKLSRGLTLEGLSVSYYLRASRMYDTLMQMGRWFGYRPGYVDLCRLFISRELNEWFCHITLASQQLRDEFDYMSDVASSTPDQYALRVRTHPGVLQISASNKIRRAVEVQVSWSGRLVESYELSKNSLIIEKNIRAAVQMINQMGNNYESGRNFYLWRSVNLSLIKVFLRGFETYDNLKSASPANLLRFIELNERYNELSNWSVGIISKERTAKRYNVNNLNIGLIKRTQDRDKSNNELYYIRKSHIISPADEFIDLTEDEIRNSLVRTEQLWREAGKVGTPVHPSGEVVRNTVRKPNRPLLLLYFLDGEESAALQIQIPVVGYAISFPANDRDDSVSFAINEQLLNQFNQQDETEITQEDDED